MSTSSQVWLGLSFEMDPGRVNALPGPHGGLVIDAVEKFSPAFKAGVQRGDELLQLAGKPVRALSEALALADAAGIGGTLVAELKRGGAPLTVTVTLFERKKVVLDLDDVSSTIERKISPAA